MSNFIAKYEIKNFKKFDFLEIDNIGQINLITGDNNVGKTCLLESFLINDNFQKTLVHLNHTLARRGFYFTPQLILDKIEFPDGNYFEYLVKDITSSIQTISIFKDNKQLKLNIEFVNKLDINKEDLKLVNEKAAIKNVKGWLKQSINNSTKELQYLYEAEITDNGEYNYYPFISFNLNYSNDVPDLLREMDNLRQESESKASSMNFNHKREVIDIINEITNEQINDYQLVTVGSQKMLGISFKNINNGDFLPITQLGDGFQKIFRYVVEVMYAKQKGEDRIMIDEIDTGIHYSKLDSFWKTFVKLIEKTEIQVFATTHSKSCIDSFVDVLNSQNKTDIGRIISLQEENDSIKSYTYTIEKLNTNFDYRG
ncbi:MAG: ATP-binding protein [Bacteroidetes bacterium]|jgi:AAA15 family ATPase/GTPase|nr:ATP-binding protein [Bacteroidota bacterium]